MFGLGLDGDASLTSFTKGRSVQRVIMEIAGLWLPQNCRYLHSPDAARAITSKLHTTNPLCLTIAYESITLSTILHFHLFQTALRMSEDAHPYLCAIPKVGRIVLNEPLLYSFSCFPRISWFSSASLCISARGQHFAQSKIPEDGNLTISATGRMHPVHLPTFASPGLCVRTSSSPIQEHRTGTLKCSATKEPPIRFPYASQHEDILFNPVDPVNPVQGQA